MIEYIANRNIWHSGHQRRYYPGEIVPLGHLMGEEIDRLIEIGTVSVVEKVISKPPRKKRVYKKRG